MKKRLERRSLLLLFLLLIFCVAASIQINEKAKKNRLNLKTGSTEEFRKLGMEEAFFQVLAKTNHEKEEDFMPFIFWKTACFHRITKKSCLKNGRKKKSGNLLKRSVQLFGMISAIFLFRNHRNIHSIRYLLWTAGWESAPTEEKGDMKAVI